MKKLSILALGAFLLSFVSALPVHAQDTSSCRDCAVGDPLGGRVHKKKMVKKTDASTSAPAAEGSAPKADTSKSGADATK